MLLGLTLGRKVFLNRFLRTEILICYWSELDVLPSCTEKSCNSADLFMGEQQQHNVSEFKGKEMNQFIHGVGGAWVSAWLQVQQDTNTQAKGSGPNSSPLLRMLTSADSIVSSQRPWWKRSCYRERVVP